MKMQRSSLSMLSLSMCLGIGAPALAQEAAAPEAQEATAPAQASTSPEAQQSALPPTEQPAASAFAPPTPPNLRLYYANINFLRYNPIGIETQHRMVFQKRLSESKSPLFYDTFVNGALAVKLNPASMKVGPVVEFQPITMLNVRATYEYLRFFGAFGFLQSYGDPALDFSDDSRADTKDNAYSTGGQHFMVEPTLQAKVGSFVVRSKASIEYWNVDLREGNRAAFYDALLDTLVPGKGWVFTNDSDLLMLASPQLTLGARFSAVWPRYENDSGAPKTDNSHMRIGPMAAYSFHTREGSSFNRPTLFVNAAWYLKHPNRSGGMPYIAAGFSFTSDLMSSKN
jgi:hypothetical protein